MLDIFPRCAIIQKLFEQRTKYGGIAQLGERLNGIQEVSGSIPLISTKTNRKVGLFRYSAFLRVFQAYKQQQLDPANLHQNDV